MMPGTRVFLFLCLAVTATGILLASLSLANTLPSEAIPQEVTAGHQLWQTNQCGSCHSLQGYGGAYGPDLTRITSLRGETYIREFMVNPAAFHPDERLMPRFNLRQAEIGELIAFLEWQDQTSTWPAQPIQVAGMGSLGMSSSTGTSTDDGDDSAVAAGQRIYSQRCASCHSIERDVIIVGPSLWGIADRGGERVSGQSAGSYIRESMLNPSDYIVEGYADVMQKNLGEVLSSQDVDHVVAFLMTLEAE